MTLPAAPDLFGAMDATWPPARLVRLGPWTLREGAGGGQRVSAASAHGPKTAILARRNDRPAGVAFVARDGKTAMIHAIETVPDLRRLGAATNMLRAAAHWAQDQGATNLSLAVTRANSGANALYSSLGMHVAGYYQYRIKQGREPATEQS